MEGQEIQSMAEAVDDIREQQQMFQNKVAEVRTLIDEMRRQLEEAKTKLNLMVRVPWFQSILKLCCLPFVVFLCLL